MSFQKIMRLEEIWEGEKMQVKVDGKSLLLIRLAEQIYAYEDRCAHLGVPMSEGTLQGDTLTCRAHEWQYNAKTGCGLNPRSARLWSYPVKIEGGYILINLKERSQAKPKRSLVGPILQSGELTTAVVAAIRELNQDVEVRDHGAYLRVLVPGQCRLTSAAVERFFGGPFVLPGSLEAIMSSFQGKLSFGEDEALWVGNSEARNE